MTIHVSDVVKNKARVAGVEQWVDGLPELIADLERAGSITVGESEPSPPVTQVAGRFFSCSPRSRRADARFPRDQRRFLEQSSFVKQPAQVVRCGASGRPTCGG